jgi:predicted amidophosphoribosyltransferase
MKTFSAEHRMRRERHTMEVMVKMYCQEVHHSREKLCAECQELWQYAMTRLDKCPLRADKPTCLKCPIHCYKPERREQMRHVMRYSGPRMLKKYPLLAILHLLDGWYSKCKK